MRILPLAPLPSFPGRRETLTRHALWAPPAPRLAVVLALLGALSLVLLSGCAGHESRTFRALSALDRGHPQQAIASLNEELDVAKVNQVPVDVGGDNALLLLDRATVLQSLGDHKLSSRDFGVADKQIVLLDITSKTAGDVGRYLYSDDAGPYRAPAYEKLLLNTLNLINYLAMADLSGARVEARRLAVMQKFIRDRDGDKNALLGLGSYLAGFAFEKSGDVDAALNFYDDALRYAAYRSLRDPLRALVREDLKSPGIKAMIEGTEPLPSVEESGEAELLVLIGFGRVPQKEPVRVPIGWVLTYLAHDLSPHDRARANQLALKGLVTWINYPRLKPGKGQYATPTATLDGRPLALEQAVDVEKEVRKDWEGKKRAILLSAVTRMLARTVVGEATQAAAGEEKGLGLLLGLAATATLSVLDKPDTRCWSTLPARVALARVRVPAGKRTVTLSARGETKTFEVDLRPGGFGVVSMSALR